MNAAHLSINPFTVPRRKLIHREQAMKSMGNKNKTFYFPSKCCHRGRIYAIVIHIILTSAGF